MSAGAPDQGKKDVFLNISIPEAEKKAIQEWAHQHRMTASAAARCMIRFALAKGVRPDDEPDYRRKGGKPGV